MARFVLKEKITLKTLGSSIFELGRYFKIAGKDVQAAFVQHEGPSGSVENLEDYVKITEAQTEILRLIDTDESKVNDDIPLEIRFVFDHLSDKNEPDGETKRIVYIAVPDFTDYEDGNSIVGDDKLTNVAREAMGCVSIMGCTN